jgi:hypothetical protein
VIRSLHSGLASGKTRRARVILETRLEDFMKSGFIVFLVCASTALAEQVKNPISTVAKEILARQEKNLTAAAEEMPADKFSFKPTPAQMSFAALIIHVVKSNVELCGQAAAYPFPPLRQIQETDPKEKLLIALNRSFVYCDSAFEHLDDSKMADSVELYGGEKGPRVIAVFALTNDWADHYAAAAMYLRLNGLLPPTAQGKK